MKKPPKWNDDEAVAEFVGEVIADANAAHAYKWSDPYYDLPPVSASEVLASMERQAIEAAEDGDTKPLGDLIKNPFFKGFGWVLSEKALDVIAAKLRGEFKGKRGPRKQTFLERDLDPKYDAADEVAWIANILNIHYPKARGHTQRAIAIAAKRAGIDPEKFANYYLKSRHRRRPT